MGIAVGDWNGDGHQDLFLTHWLAQENALYANLLTEPGGSLRFRDEADRFGLGQIALDFVSWGTSFFDYDNDGNLDLLVVNGSTLQDRSDPTRLVPMRSQLFWNRGPEAGFYDTSPVGGSYFQQSYGGRGAAFADYDNDGDVDVFVVNHGGPAVLLRNDGGNRNRWLSVELRGKRSNPQGIGATIRVTAGGHTQVRQVGCQASYLSQNSLIETFGLGAISQADTVEVIWPSKIRQRRTGVAANQRIQIIEDEDPANPEPEAASAGTERERITEFWSRYREATALRIAGKIAEAARGYDRALALNGRHEDGLYYLGSLQLELGNFPEAERAWQRLAAVNPGSARAHSRLGALYLCLDPGAPFSPARAIEQFRRAHEINKEETGPLLHLAEASILGGDPTGAAGYLVAVLGSNASSPPANFYQGYLAWKTGRAEPARAAFARAMQGAALAAPGLPTGATQEGDTRKGATDSSENGGYCGALARLSAGLGGIAPGELGSEMERRYRALDRLIAPGR